MTKGEKCIIVLLFIRYYNLLIKQVWIMKRSVLEICTYPVVMYNFWIDNDQPIPQQPQKVIDGERREHMGVQRIAGAPQRPEIINAYSG